MEQEQPQPMFNRGDLVQFVGRKGSAVLRVEWPGRAGFYRLVDVSPEGRSSEEWPIERQDGLVLVQRG